MSSKLTRKKTERPISGGKGSGGGRVTRTSVRRIGVS